ncbi:MogA/MoaB family molybdenum cofactor biosynthesis protein [Thermococcus gammatolerans]|uniref:Molybdenum cofactor biosynthesis protein B (MoaB) n=1 Tax=Thermococcus gammatolerans (strain DSM 15229 / JCM 11827 / EJ3) TaxID=593117 RepID=C5A6T0_THEGJ|nr:MogA/MoaB family molybdenum cofactor biosynthesis protein [Thermococcus gammatolerans]ACS33942.1 Molybdenum cofactor biosynthesis protein B (moaB) [Thermococcus gammatolerans EJ3]
MGVEEHRRSAPKKFKFAVITVSDTASRGEKEDKSGKFLVDELQKNGHECVLYRIVPDEKIAIIGAIVEAFEAGADVVVTSGGTGITSRDITIESVRPLFDKELTGFGEIFRLMSYEEIGTAAVMTRATAGVIRSSGRAMAVFCLPGSLGAAKTGIGIILKEAGHVLKHGRE